VCARGGGGVQELVGAEGARVELVDSRWLEDVGVGGCRMVLFTWHHVSKSPSTPRGLWSSPSPAPRPVHVHDDSGARTRVTKHRSEGLWLCVCVCVCSMAGVSPVGAKLCAPSCFSLVCGRDAGLMRSMSHAFMDPRIMITSSFRLASRSPDHVQP
jgi:hypothetical protein